MKKMFLTGPTGFIGSHLVKNLEDFDVTCLVASPEIQNTKEIPKNFNIEFADLTNYTSVQNIIRKTQPDIIIHLAALTPVRHSFERPEIYQDVNYMAVINLVNSALALKSFEKFVFASTMETYGWQTQRKPFTENLPLNPGSPYAVSKVAAENYIKVAGRAFNLPYMIAKPCNTYGRKTETGYIIEYLISQMLKNKPPSVGTPDAVRDLQYVDDHVNAYLSLIKYDLESEKERKELLENDPSHYVFNFGWGLELTVAEVAEKIKKMVGYDGDIAHGFPKDYPFRPVAEEYLSLNASKSEKILKWKPKVNLEDGLKKTVEYWKTKLL